MLISTPYFRTLTSTHTLGCDETADSTYGPYDLFCLETRLYPIIYQIFNRDVGIIFRSVYENDRIRSARLVTTTLKITEYKHVEEVAKLLKDYIEEETGIYSDKFRITNYIRVK